MVVVNGEPLQCMHNILARYAWYYMQVIQLDLPLHDYYGFGIHAWFGLDLALSSILIPYS